MLSQKYSTRNSTNYHHVEGKISLIDKMEIILYLWMFIFQV